jgi:nucleotide-binding universal stress UspA family protein
VQALGIEDGDVFQRILCATDFSETAEAAWEVACELARVHRAELVLVHVFVALPLYALGETPAPAVARAWEEQRAWVQSALDERVAAAAARGLTARALLKVGASAAGIADTAAEERADLVVIGTHGRTGFNRLLLGSVAERVVRIAPCPVLTVKPGPAAGQTRAAA